LIVSSTAVGIIGCGNISSIYLKNCHQRFRGIHVAAVADIDLGRAQAQAAEYGVAKACSVEELLADPSIDIVINLTVPAAHGEVALKAIAAGKSVYNEKPLAVARSDAQAMLAQAKAKGVRVGGAPDTFLGAGLQTCRKLIDDGWIGRPIGATAFMMGRGPEGWHPNPHFFYQPGAGPMFDMGPYYLTALTTLLGPVNRVSGSAQISFAERTITNNIQYGQKIPVNTATHVVGVLDFSAGAVASIITSFDVWHSTLPWLEIYGSEGTMLVPDPNNFSGAVKVRRGGAEQWSDMPLTHSFAENSRGLGVLDMAVAIQEGRAHRASGDLAYHVLDIMHAIHDASNENRHIHLTSGIERPAPMPLGMDNKGF
jgi:predicted dehydrogenase